MDKVKRFSLEAALSLVSGKAPPRPAEAGISDVVLDGDFAVVSDGFSVYVVDKAMVKSIQEAAAGRIQALAQECVLAASQWQLAARMEELARSCYLAGDERAELVYTLWKKVMFLRDKNKAKQIMDAVVTALKGHFAQE